MRKKFLSVNFFAFQEKKGYMVQTRLMAISLGHQESGNASSHPNHAPAPPDDHPTTVAVHDSYDGRIDKTELEVN